MLFRSVALLLFRACGGREAGDMGGHGCMPDESGLVLGGEEPKHEVMVFSRRRQYERGIGIVQLARERLGKDVKWNRSEADADEARAFASRAGARLVTVSGPSEIPAALSAALQ